MHDQNKEREIKFEFK